MRAQARRKRERKGDKEPRAGEEAMRVKARRERKGDKEPRAGEGGMRVKARRERKGDKEPRAGEEAMRVKERRGRKRKGDKGPRAGEGGRDAGGNFGMRAFTEDSFRKASGGARAVSGNKGGAYENTIRVLLRSCGIQSDMADKFMNIQTANHKKTSKGMVFCKSLIIFGCYGMQLGNLCVQAYAVALVLSYDSFM